MAQVKGFSLGGLGAPCCCAGGPPPTCNVTICAVGCLDNFGNPLPVIGATVTIKSGPTTIATGTTASNGCVTLNIATSGIYTVTITASSYDATTSTQALICGNTYTFSMNPASGYHCFCPTNGTLVGCSNPYPNTLTLNDGIGSLTITWIGGAWQGCDMRTINNEYVSDGTCSVSATVGSTSIPVRFTLVCSNSANCPNYRFYVQVEFPAPCTGLPLPNQAGWQTGLTCSYAGPWQAVQQCGNNTPIAQTLQCEPLLLTFTPTFAPPIPAPSIGFLFDMYGASTTFTVMP